MQYSQPKHQGDPTIASLANGLGTLGRYGDSYMVHAAEGETVVPAEILAANPELKNQLFWQMRMMGIKDPNRYVVGNTLNSINPVTGQPEFWFKKIFRAVKKVFKKALPVIAPIVGNLIAPGIGGIIASGLVTKLQGGSWGDVLKSAALSYGIGALGQGIGGGLSGLAPGGTGFGTGFSEGLGKGIMAPFQAAGNLFSGTGLPLIGGGASAANPLSQGILGQGGIGALFPSTAGAPTNYNYGRSGLFPKYNPLTNVPVPAGRLIPTKSGLQQLPTQTPWEQQWQAGGPSGPAGPDMTGGQMWNVAGEEAVWARDPNRGLVQLNSSEAAQLRASGKLATGGSGEHILTSDWEGSLVQPQVPSVSAPSVGGQGGPPTGSLGEVRKFGEDYYKWGPRGNEYGWNPADAPKPSFWSAEGAKQFAGKAAEQLAMPVALGVAAYAMSPDEQTAAEKVQGLAIDDPRRIAYEKWKLIEDKTSSNARQLYNTWYGAPTQTAEQLATNVGITLEQAQAQPQFAYNIQPTTAAHGGIVSLQGGGEITGPGSGTSDSIPARLSDGEFVMTADAVRGMGNGSRDLGAARMYDLMSRYERTV